MEYNMTLEERRSKLEELVIRTWEPLTPRLEALDEEILISYLGCPGPVSPYRIARRLGINMTSVYRRSRRLLEWRLLIPGLEPATRDKLMISVKGCLYLYVRGRIGLDVLTSCYSRLWGLPVEPRALLAMLYLIGLEASRRRLDLRTLTMCLPDEAAVHVLRYFYRALELHEELGVGFAEALDSVAYSVYLDRVSFREALRLAFRALANRILPSIENDGHHVVVILSGRRAYPVVVWCATPCKEYLETLGVECERVRRSLEAILSTRVNGDRGRRGVEARIGSGI